MKGLWNDADATRCRSDLDLRIYTSRLLGRDSTLVLHSGGNTSVKVRKRGLFGEEEDILYLKGSGWDLETIEAPGFAPVRMAHLLKRARRHCLPFYVAAPLSTIDPRTEGGAAIPIEERGAAEVRGHAGLEWAPAGVAVRNPAFDVTPAELVTALIT